MESSTQKLAIARCLPFGVEQGSVGTYLFCLGYHLATKYPALKPYLYEVSKNEQWQMHNLAVRFAQKWECQYLLFVSSELSADPRLKRAPSPEEGFENRFRPFFDSAWKYMQANKDEMGPMVLAAPTCGWPPEEEVQVFERVEEGKLRKIPRDRAGGLTGWHRVGAVGCNLMLIDMQVFDRLNHPYFEAKFRDLAQTELYRGGAVMFCRKCTEADVPIFVNFDCWSDHWHSATSSLPILENVQ